MPLQAVLGREGKECKECVQFSEHNPNKYEGKEGLRTPLGGQFVFLLRANDGEWDQLSVLVVATSRPINAFGTMCSKTLQERSNPDEDYRCNSEHYIPYILSWFSTQKESLF